MSLANSKSDSSSNVMNKQWWRVCFVHGDQTKFYRQLYGKRAAIRTQIRDPQPGAESGAESSMDISICDSSLNTSLQQPQNSFDGSTMMR